MSNQAKGADLAEMIGNQLPYLRRYARALTGSQQAGDDLASQALEAILANPSIFDRSLHPKLALFKVFHAVRDGDGADQAAADTALAAAAQEHLSKLTPRARDVLLLSVIEGFSTAEIAQVMDIPREEVHGLLDTAYSEIESSVRGKVMIIEDEAIIAMDLESIVSGLGHHVTGVARTHKGAVSLAARDKPNLILADIHLADDSSGIDAVKEIVKEHGDRPVIFITAYPERLLKGERYEPAFMIAKPYTEQQVRVAVSQAMFFSSTETLKA